MRGEGVGPLMRGTGLGRLMRGEGVGRLMRGAGLGPLVRGAGLGPLVRGAGLNRQTYWPSGSGLCVLDDAPPLVTRGGGLLACRLKQQGGRGAESGHTVRVGGETVAHREGRRIAGRCIKHRKERWGEERRWR